MNRFTLGFVSGLLAVALIAGAAQAQEGQKGRRGGGGGLFGGGNSLIFLAGNEAVQKDIGVGDAEKAKIEAISREANEARREAVSAAGVDFANFQNLSDDERRAAGEKLAAANRTVNEKFEPKLKEALTAEQFKRLQEIGVQAAGSGALADARVAKELALTDEQTKKIADIRADFGQKQRALFGQGGGEDAFAKMRELREEETKKVTEVLTKEQQDKLAALKGKPFDVAALRGGFGGGRPGAKGKNRPKAE